MYQLYVALQMCFEMTSGQRVIIERFGDVTVGKSRQIETKQYAEPLTDNHDNLWKTLGNWMDDGFDDTPYSALILVTTQEISASSTIAAWNELDCNSRIAILEKILQASEARFEKKMPKVPPASLTLQRKVLAAQKRHKLLGILERFTIASCSPDGKGIYDRLRDQYCKTVLPGKQRQFLDALLGFIVSPDVASTTWEITYEDFTNRCQDLSLEFCVGTQEFPRRFLSPGETSDPSEVRIYHSRPFVQKILDIEYEEVVSEAIQDFLAASRTILEEFRDYDESHARYDEYAREVLAVFRPRFRAALRNVADVIRDSQTFYDGIIAEPSPGFRGFETPPKAFRNGVLHIQFDDESKQLKWSLK
jgi:hypothetical protein